MDLVERYVNEVGRKLPRKGRADIKAELNSLLRDTADDRYKGQATEDDIVALLQEFGSPEEVAASYRPAGQYLIGPELFPIFKLVIVAMLLAVTIGLTVALAIGFIFTDRESLELGQTLLEALNGYFQAYSTGFTVVVIVFAILQRLDVKPDEESGDEWDPRSLPDVKDIDQVGRGEAAAGAAVSIVFLVLLNLFADRIGFVVTWGDAPLFTNILHDNMAWLNIALLLSIGLWLILLVQGRWHIYTRLAKVAIDLFWIFVAYQIVITLSGEKAAMVEAGLVEPLPAMFVGIGYLVILIMVISFVVNQAKWIGGSIREAVTDNSLTPKMS
jgi:hypothetical protein